RKDGTGAPLGANHERRKNGYLHSEVGNPVFSGALESGRFVQYLVARHGKPAVRCVQYRVGY
ncbi:MAG: hypothetical protein KJZ92_17245, partial [Rhodocyclaceae bacterium]|nr:hypothetical protein [Rhodocyclaceae bacterium]